MTLKSRILIIVVTLGRPPYRGPWGSILSWETASHETMAGRGHTLRPDRGKLEKAPGGRRSKGPQLAMGSQWWKTETAPP